MLIVVNFEYCNLYERYPKVIKVVATLHIRCSLAVVILLSGLTAVNGILTSLNDAARSDLSQGRRAAPLSCLQSVHWSGGVWVLLLILSKNYF